MDIVIDHSHFVNNSVIVWAGALLLSHCNVTINTCRFTDNHAHTLGGVINDLKQSTIDIYQTDIIGNSANFGGVLFMWETSLTVNRSQVTNNSAIFGGVLHAFETTAIYLIDSNFTNNAATIQGGVVVLLSGHAIVTGSAFTGNWAKEGGVVYTSAGTITSYGFVEVSNNSANFSVIYLVQSTAHFYGVIKFSDNLGSLLAFKSRITFAGNTTFFNCSQPEINHSGNFQEGGALTAFQSDIYFNSTCKLKNNHAKNGGALLLISSKSTVNSNTTIINNAAIHSGGGAYLYQSEITCHNKSTLTFSNNHATSNGGGIHLSGSTINIESLIVHNYTFNGSLLRLVDNVAKKGGGLFLEANSKVNVLKDVRRLQNYSHYTVNFTANTADYGGAVYVDDNTNPGTCDSTSFRVQSPRTECSFQVLAINNVLLNSNKTFQDIYFNENSATISGSILFGGLFDRCTVSPFAEVYLVQKGYEEFHPDTDLPDIIDGANFIASISTVTYNFLEISSKPVKVCFCIDNQPDCNIDQLPSIEVSKGTPFNVSLAATDQMNNTVNATIQSRLSSLEGGLGEGQLTQTVGDECTNLTFNVFSTYDSEDVTLYAADGPCKDSSLSTKTIMVKFLRCSCPIGFQLLSDENTRCSCKCHSDISEYVTCNSITETIVRNSNIWIMYANNTEASGYLVYLHCPFDYCGPLNAPVNLNQPNGTDAQCAFNRSGLLCGSCQPGLSLSLGSSRCLSCPSYWPGLFAAITVAGILAGIALVAILLLLNLTVAVGTINALVFYANILAANNYIFFPFAKQNPATVFISWLNLELGIDTCYFQGMDAYAKVWLQLAFPTYVLFLVIMVIVLSQTSSRFSHMIGTKNPIATLATLFIFSYAKLLQTVIRALSFGILKYPNGSHQLVWLPDASVKYFAGKHIPMFIASIFILLVGLAYTALLFTSQWLPRLPRWRIFRWIRDHRLHAFLETYCAPYYPKHRYWTGLLLSARIILYLVSAVNVSGNPRVSFTSILLVVGSIVLIKCFISNKIYHKWPIDVLETFFHFNIIFLAILTWYTLDVDGVPNNITYTSISASFILVLVIISYHLYTYTTIIKKLFKSSPKKDTGECEVDLANCSVSRESQQEELTYSFVDKPQKPETNDTYLENRATNPMSFQFQEATDTYETEITL